MRGTTTWPGLELFRAACAAGMVWVHAFYFLISQHGQIALHPDSPILHHYHWGMLLGCFPMWLPFVGGIRLGAWTAAGGLSWRRIWISSLGFAAAGILMNVLAAGPGSWGHWNVLQFFGLSTLVVGSVHRLTGRRAGWILAGISLAALTMGGVLRGLNPSFPLGRFAVAVLGGGQYEHAWPFCPWFASVTLGIGIHRWSLIRKTDDTIRGGSLLAVGLAMVAAATWSRVFPPDFSGEDMIGESVFLIGPAKFAGVMGLALLLLGVMTLARGNRPWVTGGMVDCFSRGVFWIYMVHLPLLTRIDILFGDWLALPSRLGMMRDLSSWLIFLGWPAAFLILSYGVGWLIANGPGRWRLNIRLRRVLPSHE